MAHEQHNTALDFETMLRRHLSRGGSVVEACMGFDADTANAYLENALNASARSRYDSHLAGCPSCRRHVIELSRLMQLPQPESNLAPAVAPASIWSHWKSVVSEWGEWLGLANWQQGWATAGIAAAILIGVVSVQLWRQQQNGQPAGTNFATTDAANVNSTKGAGDNSILPSEGVSATPGVAGQAGTGEPRSQTLAVNNVPKPDVSPNPNSSSLLAGNHATVGSTFVQPVGTQPMNLMVTTPPSLPVTQSANGVVVTSLSGGQTFNAPIARSVSAELTAPAPPPMKESELRDNVVAAQIGPLPSENPMARKPKESRTQKSSSSVFDKAFSFMPSRRTENAAKQEEKEIEQDAPKLLTIRRRDKVFNYQSGFWVDSSYKPEMAWRVTKVVLDSEDYKQLLAAEPLLKEYFAHGQAIVVWKDKIYKVVAK
ncbi:MAG: zf-HC2 domain-containing protein [Acidobacteria bacterium]|nr:zf-HC2 domain-containing protein [Acidobacteriota bacterium]